MASDTPDAIVDAHNIRADKMYASEAQGLAWPLAGSTTPKRDASSRTQVAGFAKCEDEVNVQ
jgi:hypothetical protein